MSAGARLQAAVVRALKGDPALAGVAVFDAPPMRAAAPHAVVGEPVLADWSAVGVSGRQGRIDLVLHDGGERPVRLRAQLAAAEDAVAGMPADLGEGWRAVRLLLMRSALARVPDRSGADRWAASASFAVRVLRADA